MLFDSEGKIVHLKLRHLVGDKITIGDFYGAFGMCFKRAVFTPYSHVNNSRVYRCHLGSDLCTVRTRSYPL